MRDGVAYSVMRGAGETYFAAYALFLGATAAQISLLAALPPLFGAITQLFAAWLETRVGRRRRVILTAASIQACTWFPLIWLPYLFPAHAVPAMVTCVVLYYGWSGLGAPLWSSLMGELVPPRRRGRFFSGRTQLMSIWSFMALVVGGVMLQVLEFHDNARLAFVLLFTAAAIARLWSIYHLARMHEPDAAAPRSTRAPDGVRYSKRFLHFSGFIAAMNFAVSVAGPFITLYMLKDLGFSYLEFALAAAAFVLLQFLSLRAWGRLADVYGNRALLVVTGVLVPLIPALWLLSSAFGWVLFLQAVAGWVWAGFGLAVGNYLYEIVPPEQASRYFATHNMVKTVGACVGALLGGVLISKLPHSIEVFGHTLQWKSGLWGLMLLSALLRGVVLLAFLGRIEEVRAKRVFSLRMFAFGMLRFNHAGNFLNRHIGRRRRQSTALSLLRMRA